MKWIRRNLKLLLPATVVAVGVIGYLAFAVFGVHTLFIDDKVDEAGPVFASGAADAAAETSPDTAVVDVGPADTAAPSETPAPSETKVDKLGAGGEVQASLDAVTEADLEPADLEPAATEPAEPQIVTLVEGSFIPRGRYDGEGQALVLNDGSEQRFLRFENFATDNGPDLRVYLVNSDANADEGTFDDDFVDLGVLAGNIGDQNYEISPEVDLEVYDTVVVWCVRFSSAFTAADLIAV